MSMFAVRADQKDVHAFLLQKSKCSSCIRMIEWMTKSSAASNLSIPNFSLKAAKLLFRKQSNISSWKDFYFFQIRKNQLFVGLFWRNQSVLGAWSVWFSLNWFKLDRTRLKMSEHIETRRKLPDVNLNASLSRWKVINEIRRIILH